MLSLVKDKVELQLAALKMLMQFMLRPPLDLTGPVVSKQVFGVEGFPTDVLAEMVTWAEYLKMKNVQQAIDDLLEFRLRNEAKEA